MGKQFATSPNCMPFVNRTLAEVEADRNRVIYERHHGWEKASFSLLSAIFDLPAREIGRICRDPANAPHHQPAVRGDQDGAEISNHNGGDR